MILNIRLDDAKWHRQMAFDRMVIAHEQNALMNEAYAFADFDLWDTRIEIEECAYCFKYKGQMHPDHFASYMCKSGKRNHCTCDTCF